MADYTFETPVEKSSSNSAADAFVEMPVRRHSQTIIEALTAKQSLTSKIQPEYHLAGLHVSPVTSNISKGIMQWSKRHLL